MDWIAFKHALLSHLPVALGLLLPWPLLAAQRPGRGIRPWWTVSRYLGWAGALGLVAAFVSGYLKARALGLIPPQRILPQPVWTPGPEGMLFRHSLLVLGALVVGAGALWAMNRPRKDHESLGLLTLLLGVAWSVLLLLVGESGYRLAVHAQTRAAAPAKAPVLVVATPVQLDPEARVPVRMLDHEALEPVHPEPVKSLAHGGRWIRAWVSPEAAPAYRAGRPLPQGALVVLSSQEDRWGRPGSESGPLYALEMKASGPALSLYWARIPAERRREFAGEARAYWRGDDARLGTCRTCHAEGPADPGKRSRWRPKRLPSGD